MCRHDPACPATVVARHDDQGWSLMSDGSIVFDDTGELLPNGRIVPPHRPLPVSVNA
ncbi:DUF5999 family protein [Streptomyces sp. NPDC086549]|uniref:DUF5999 family protein n=1 Tax=Streptomyces sp. NPDC086549 TaxID=3365752 RepID=UPI003809AE52